MVDGEDGKHDRLAKCDKFRSMDTFEGARIKKYHLRGRVIHIDMGLCYERIIYSQGSLHDKSKMGTGESTSKLEENLGREVVVEGGLRVKSRRWETFFGGWLEFG